MRGQGVGKAVMNKLNDWADKNDQVLDLVPAGSHKNSRKFLIDWYKKFGYVENKGKNDNDKYQYMYRIPFK